MEKLILTLTITLISTTLFSNLIGKLRCWDNNNQSELIPSYIEETLNSTSYIDENGRRSFIMDFTSPLTRWEFERVGFKVKYGWSISECEDWSEFIFRRIELEKVLKGERKYTNLKYFYHHLMNTSYLGF